MKPSQYFIHRKLTQLGCSHRFNKCLRNFWMTFRTVSMIENEEEYLKLLLNIK